MEKQETYEKEVRVCIAIQKLGKATDQEVFNKLEEDGIKISLKQVAKATTNLQKRGLVSLNYDNSSGYAVKAYSMAKQLTTRQLEPKPWK